ncbi:amidohydrolase family protein [Propylenella binzhouense]|uniref:Amidohydrolase n=1 Tax=Propylenella binzhouense TaxID=2555902 RepID=A0A964WSS2_9HYPH|nr:amidohydrolase family protein [Propylenella binzhouense]MYZ47268.1 amidohydrolase [Propylenella binzhouense]
MIIDAHAHLFPPTLLDKIRKEKGRFPSVAAVEAGDSLSLGFAGGKLSRPVAKGLTDIAGRKAWMAKNGIDRQIVGGWVDSFGYELPPKEGAAWASLINEDLMETAKAEPAFVPLADVPLQSGAEAAAILREAHSAGFRGAMIGTQPNGKGSVLDAPELDPFWQEADRLGSVLFIHPVFDSGDDRNLDYGMPNAVGRITDTMIAVSRLLYSGHVLRYSGAKIVIGIGGAGLPIILGRLRRNHSLDPEKLADPVKGIASMYYDTLIHDANALKFVASVVGTDRMMLGSDMPFPIGDMEPKKVVEEAGFDEAARASIYGGLAEKLLAG